MRRLLNWAEFQVVRAMGRIVGISYVIHYLRNPNPLITTPLLQAFGAQVGPKTKFKRSILIDNAYEDQNSAGDFRHLRVGSNCYIGDAVYFDLAGEVILEDDAVISGQVAFVTHADCNRSEVVARAFPRQCSPIRVHSGAWVGFRATILAGVTIGKNSVIAAHCLLKDDAEPATLYAGIPGRRIRGIEEPKKIKQPAAI